MVIFIYIKSAMRVVKYLLKSNIFRRCKLLCISLHWGIPHAHQPNILKYPLNENFISLQLFMRIQLIFLFWETTNFLT